MSKFDAFINDLDGATALELNELVKAIEEKFGVSAAAVASAGPAAGASDASAEEEKNAFTVVLASTGDQKIAVMKVVKEVLALGLKEAKDLVDGAPATLKEGMKKEEANDFKKKLEEAGAKVELK
jgi:large subunit ribosomal protein L7/L12